MDGNILNAFLTLSLVVGALGALLFLLKKTAVKKNIKSQYLDMKILSRMTLNPKNHLYIVEAGDKRLLLGVSESGIRNLTEIAAENNEINSLNTPFTESKPVLNKIKDDSLSFKSFLKSTFSIVKN